MQSGRPVNAFARAGEKKKDDLTGGAGLSGVIRSEGVRVAAGRSIRIRSDGQESSSWA
jgi:hypothetical protein